MHVVVGGGRGRQEETRERLCLNSHVADRGAWLRLDSQRFNAILFPPSFRFARLTPQNPLIRTYKAEKEG